MQKEASNFLTFVVLIIIVGGAQFFFAWRKRPKDGEGTGGILAPIFGAISLLKKQDAAVREATVTRQRDITDALRKNAVPATIRDRLQASRDGTAPWLATLRPAEMLIARSHGIRPIAAVSATCWMHYGYSWTRGHAQGWDAALRRLGEEAKAVGANAVLDVKMRTVPLNVESSMDFSLVGTAVKIDGLPPSTDPVIATLPALEFVKLLEADIVPTGIAVGADYEWLNGWWAGTGSVWNNAEADGLSRLWERVRRRALDDLRTHAREKGNGVLAHINFSQMFEQEQNDTKQYLARHIIIATTVEAPLFTSAGTRQVRILKNIPHEFQPVVDMRDNTPLTGRTIHHQSYASNDEEGAI